MLQYSTYSVVIMVSILYLPLLFSVPILILVCFIVTEFACDLVVFFILEVKEKLHQHLDKVEICILFSSKQEGLCTFGVNFAIGEGKFGLLFSLNSIQHLAFYAQT